MGNKISQQQSKPIIGLSPMDGVTDAACRYITDKYGKPDLLLTEFTSVEGLSHGAVKLLEAFVYHKTDTPTIAQIYGSDPESFYKVAFIACELGFDGIDINMGCPDSAVARKGGGAALILKPQLAQEIIYAVKKGVNDWAEGKRIEDVDLKESIIHKVAEMKKEIGVESIRQQIPVSVKTRIGYEEIVTEDWISNLLETKPAAITIHGRTLRQMYTGQANWEEIGKATAIIKKTDTIVLGNGDIKSLEDAKEKIKTYNTDGVLIGRASFGNPWIFKNLEPSSAERLNVAKEHCQAFTKMTPEAHFLSLRKHLAWYCKGFEGAAEIRVKFMQVQNLPDVEAVIEEALQQLS